MLPGWFVSPCATAWWARTPELPASDSGSLVHLAVHSQVFPDRLRACSRAFYRCRNKQCLPESHPMETNAKTPIVTTPLRVLLVDDSEQYLSALTRYLGYQPWAQVVGVARTGAEAIKRALTLAPDLIFMDIVMPETNGIEATEKIKRWPRPPRIIMLSLHDNAEYRYYAQQAGADAYLVKSELESALPRLMDQLLSPLTPKVVEINKLELESTLARRALQESEERLRLALEAGGMGTFDWNIETGVITWSREHAQLFGLRLEEFDGSYDGFARCVHPEDLASIGEALDQAQRDRAPYSHKFRVVWPNGEIRWISGKGQFRFNATNRVAGMNGVVQDVTETMLALINLKENQNQLNAIILHNPQCIQVLNAQYEIQEINPAGRRLFGLINAEAATGKAIFDFVRLEYRETVSEFYAGILHGGENRIEFEIEHAHVGPRWVECHAVPIAALPFQLPNQGQLILSVMLDINERKLAEAQINFLAHHDRLTGLPNRSLFIDRLSQAILEAQRHGRIVGVAFLDLDRFTNINDTLGYEVGDAIIREAARRLRGVLRPSDTVARIGGDEFAVVLNDMAKAEDAPLIIQKLLDALKAPFQIGDHELFLSASVGATLYPGDGTDAETLMLNADTAMYRVKAERRSTCQFYTNEMTIRAREDMALEGALRHAIERNELTVHYQPILDLHNGHIQGMEALLRWQHPELGAISPTRFIPIAEESGLILSIGEWVLRQACKQMRVWRDAGMNKVHVAVNFSSRQFREPDLAERILEILAETGLEGHFLEIELTESMLLTNVETTITLMQRLDAIGVRFAVDDFGTGYSSLSYLKRFPINVLKIDQSFVRDITTDADDAAIVRAIITMAHSLGMSVVAEGVETAEQVEFLCVNACDTIQGYYFSPSAAPEVMIELLEKQEIRALCLHHTALQKI